MDSLEEHVKAILSKYTCHSCGNTLSGLCTQKEQTAVRSSSELSSPREEKEFKTNLQNNRWLKRQRSEIKRRAIPVTVIDLKSKQVVSSGVPLQNFNNYTEIPAKVLEKLSASPKTANFARELKGEPIPTRAPKPKKPLSPEPPPRVEAPKPVLPPKVIQTKIVEVGNIQTLIGAPKTRSPPYASYNKRKKQILGDES